MIAPASASIFLTLWNANKLQQKRAGVLLSVHPSNAGLGGDAPRQAAAEHLGRNPLIKAIIRACSESAFEVFNDRSMKSAGFRVMYRCDPERSLIARDNVVAQGPWMMFVLKRGTPDIRA